MQYYPDAVLDAVLASGQKRYFDVLVRFDWAANGYLSTYADLSDNFVATTLDSQMNGELPDELQQEEGYSQSRLDVTLEGNLAVDAVPVWRAFSPGAGHYLGQQARLGAHMSLAVVVRRPDTGAYVPIYQFTGVVDTITPTRADGRVTITCFDYTKLLNLPVTLPQWATDWTYRYFYGYTDSTDQCWQSLSYVVEAAARQCGFFDGPRPHVNAQVWWPLSGGFLPEIGTAAIWDRDCKPYDYFNYDLPSLATANTPKNLFTNGKYGKAFNDVGSARLNAHGKALTAPHNNAATASSNYYLGFGGWMKCTSGTTFINSANFFHEDLRVNSSGTAALTQWSIRSDGTAANITVKIQNTNATTWSFVFTATVPIPVGGWHWVGIVVEYTTTQTNAWIKIDNTITQMTRTTGSGKMANFAYGMPSSCTNLIQAGVQFSAQYLQVWVSSGTSSTAANIWPEMDPPYSNMQIDTSETKLFHLPSIDGANGWDVIKAATAAEFGAVYCTETGVITWDSFTTLLARRTAAAVVKTLTLDDLEDFRPFLSLVNIANTVSYMIKQRWSQPGKAFQASKPDQFQVAAGSSSTYATTIADVQNLKLGAVTFQPQAMGYTSSGAGVTNWKDWMSYYKPDVWDDGFTGYRPNSNTDPSTQPTYATGVNAAALLGWAGGDQNPRHMRIALSNSGSSVIEYAVNDQTAFLNIQGMVIKDQASYTATVQNATSVAALNVQLLAFSGANEYRSDSVTTAALMQALVNATSQQRYQVNTVEVPGDPRVQRQDVVMVSDPAGMGTVYASIVGIRRSISRTDGIKDTYTLRTFTP